MSRDGNVRDYQMLVRVKRILAGTQFFMFTCGRRRGSGIPRKIDSQLGLGPRSRNRAIVYRVGFPTEQIVHVYVLGLAIKPGRERWARGLRFLEETMKRHACL